MLGPRHLQSLPLPSAPRPQFVYVSAPIRPEPEYRQLAQRVRRSPIPGVGFDTTIGFASIGYPLSPSTRQAPMIVVSLLPILGGLQAVEEYLLQEQVPTLFGMQHPPAAAAAVAGGNGQWR